MLGRKDVDGVAFGQNLTAKRIQLEDTLDLIAQEIDPDGKLLVGRVNRHAVAAQTELAAHKVHVVALVLHVDQTADSLVAFDSLRPA